MKIGTILDQIDIGAIALPEFQRGYVWNRDQVRALMDSLYRRHPVGSLLVWVTNTDKATTRGDNSPTPGTVKLLLDGQQRITSLYGIIRGKPPKFFDGNPQAFTGLYFHLEEEIFEFYSPKKMQDNPLWINVTELMQKGIGEFINRLMKYEELQPKISYYINRLTAIHSITDINLHIEEVTGEDKTVDVVVDIFNRVNSGGTKLSKGDLALAKICASWPEARDEMKKRLNKWAKAGFYFRLEWFLRVITSMITGEAFYTALKDVNMSTFQKGLQDAEKMVDKILNMISARLGLDHDRVLGSPYSFPLISRYLYQKGGKLGDYRERDKLLYWYIHTFLWGRYSGSTESILSQDLKVINEIDGSLDRLISQLRQTRGDLRIYPNDFIGWSKGARFYPLLYMLTRVWHAKDWGTGIELSNHLLGNLNSLQLHHIFPKALLYEKNYSKEDVNALANFTFLTQDTNLQISDSKPEEYLEEIAIKHPGALESHWIPMDKELWKIENYLEFLKARRELLANAANEFLESLLEGKVPETKPVISILERKVETIPGGIKSEEEERIILEFNKWIVQQGLPPGEFMYEAMDPKTGELLALFDLAWPNGLQEGYSPPVALLVDEIKETREIANRLGFLYFTDIEMFKIYVKKEILTLTEDEAL